MASRLTTNAGHIVAQQGRHERQKRRRDRCAIRSSDGEQVRQLCQLAAECAPVLSHNKAGHGAALDALAHQAISSRQRQFCTLECMITGAAGLRSSADVLRDSVSAAMTISSATCRCSARLFSGRHCGASVSSQHGVRREYGGVRGFQFANLQEGRKVLDNAGANLVNVAHEPLEESHCAYACRAEGQSWRLRAGGSKQRLRTEM
jgi:hypothetical protein